MGEFLSKLFSSDFMGHGFCYRWSPEIIWLHAISDCLIALSYYFIPLMLIYLVRKRRDLPFHWVFLMFGVFILSCGTTHAMEIWTLWNGTYRLAGVIKAITACASLATAAALVPLVPKALLLPSPAQLRSANQELQKEIAERRRVEEALQAERNFISAVLNTIGTAIVVLDKEGAVIQCNHASEQLAGSPKHELINRPVRSLFSVPEEGDRFWRMVGQLKGGWRPGKFESYWSGRNGEPRLIAWSTTALADGSGRARHIIAAGVDITESTRLEKTVLDISGREQARIAQDLHDDLGQHLTGVALMSMALEKKLSDHAQTESADAAEIVKLASECIKKARELSRGLLPVGSEATGLMAALELWSGEIQNRHNVMCAFHCEQPIQIYDDKVATHLFRIAQEAVTNSIKHGRPTHIDIELTLQGEGIGLVIADDGAGFSEESRNNGGLGLQIMSYRAKMIGATLQVERMAEGGTMVSCQLKSRLQISDRQEAML